MIKGIDSKTTPKTIRFPVDVVVEAHTACAQQECTFTEFVL